MKVFDFDPRNLPDAHLRAIGLVVAASAQTESIVAQVIGMLVGLRTVDCVAVTAQMGTNLRLDVAETLIREKVEPDDLKEACLEALAAVRIAIGARNGIIHRDWMRDPDTGEVRGSKTTAKGSIKVKIPDSSTTAIEAQAAAIYQSGISLFGLIFAFYGRR